MSPRVEPVCPTAPGPQAVQQMKWSRPAASASSSSGDIPTDRAEGPEGVRSSHAACSAVRHLQTFALARRQVRCWCVSRLECESVAPSAQAWGRLLTRQQSLQLGASRLSPPAFAPAQAAFGRRASSTFSDVGSPTSSCGSLPVKLYGLRSDKRNRIAPDRRDARARSGGAVLRRSSRNISVASCHQLRAISAGSASSRVGQARTNSSGVSLRRVDHTSVSVSATTLR